MERVMKKITMKNLEPLRIWRRTSPMFSQQPCILLAMKNLEEDVTYV
jgi:hypothetical protein